MIKKITITNHLGESIIMDLKFPEQSGFFIREVTGLGPSKGNIDVTEVSAIDGAIYNSGRVTSRNIVFHLGFIGTPTIEDTRQKSYKYFPLKKRINIKVETDNRTSETYGYIESNEPEIFSKEEGTVISVICPDSYLYSLTNSTTTFSQVVSLFEFPFSNESLSQNLIIFGNMTGTTTQTILYTGDAAIGITIYIHAIGPATGIEIVKTSTLEKITIDDARLIALTGAGIHEGDDIVICTVKGNKSVTLIRDGVSYNVRNALGRYPDWFEIEKGDNVFAYSAASGGINLQFKIENKIAYEGI